MNRLFWKELRQRWLWALPLMASMVVPVLLGSGLTYVGEFSAFAGWVWLPAYLALFSDWKSGRQDDRLYKDFLLFRPISRRMLALAGVLSGLIIIAAAVIASAIAFLIFHARQYDPFITPSRIMVGMVYQGLIAAGPYLTLRLAWELFSSRAGGVAFVAGMVGLGVHFGHTLLSSGPLGLSGEVWLMIGAVVTSVAVVARIWLQPVARFIVGWLLLGGAFTLLMCLESSLQKSPLQYRLSSMVPEGTTALSRHCG